MKRLIFIILLTAFHVSVFAQKKDTLTTQSGLKYVQLKAGKGKKPVNGQEVKVKFTGKLMNGTEFESGTFKFILGKKEVIPGWDEGFKLMTAGEKGVLIVPAKLAYGKKGSKDDDGTVVIPPDADLIFEVVLISFK